MKHRYRTGDPVIVNTGGADCPGRIANERCPYPALGDCLLVTFENGTRQWMPREYLRPVAPVALGASHQDAEGDQQS